MYLLILVAKSFMALHSIVVFFSQIALIPLFLLPPSFTSIPLVYHAIMAVVRDGGEYSGYRNPHRSARPQSTPKPADSRQKIKGDKKKKSTLSSFLPSPPLRYHNHQQYRSLLHSLVSLPSSQSYLPFSISPFSLLTTLPVHQMWLSPMFAPLFSIFFHPKIQFSNSPPHLSYFHLLPIYLSPSPLCICSFLLPSAHLLLCVHKHRRSNTRTDTHTHTAISLCLPPCCL